MAIYKDAEDLINIGAYVKGSNEKIDYSISVIDNILNFLQQGTHEKFFIRRGSGYSEQCP